MIDASQGFRRAARALFFAALVCILAPAAQAQQKPSPGAMADAHKLIEVTGATQLFNPLIAGVVEQAKLLFLQQNPALQKDLNEIAADLRAKLQPRFSELTDEVAKFYATDFSDKELKDILAFYESPAGKKLLQRQPQIVDQSMKFAQGWANKLSDEVVDKMRDELKKRGHAQ